MMKMSATVLYCACAWFFTLTAASAGTPDDSWRQTVQKIDAEFARAWHDEEVTPAQPASDAEFLRRVYLDVVGRIPAVSEVRQFSQNSPSTASQRQALVDELLDSPASIRHLTISLRNSLIPEATEQANLRFLVPGFEAWLWQKLADRTPYDQLARQIITTEFENTGNSVTNASRPDAFFAARNFKPEDLATATSRAFLGVRLDCAQCHDHPFDKWTQDQFWNMAAFYSGFENNDDESQFMMVPAERRTKSILIPGTERTVPAIFLTGTEPDWQNDDTTPRQLLADWIVDNKNPWFAKMAVNRLWAGFFGRGLVDPIDDFSENNPSALPEVLEILAQDFQDHGYQLDRTIRIITATKAYQLGSQKTHDSQDDPEMFARSALRGLTPEQFFDSLAEATGFYQPYRSDNPFVIQQNTPRSRFLNLFRSTDRSSLERQTTVLQALAMMNGDFVTDATSLQNSVTMKAITLFPGMTDSEKVEALYLATVSRKPNAVQLQRSLKHINAAKHKGTTTSGSVDPDLTHDGFADVFWVLLNSSEFLLNH